MLCLDGKNRLPKREVVPKEALRVGDYLRMYGGSVARVTQLAGASRYGCHSIEYIDREPHWGVNYLYGATARRLIGWGPLLGAPHDPAN